MSETARTLFAGALVWPGLERLVGEPPFPADVLVEGNRIAAIARAPARLPREGAAVIDCAGAALIPGLVDGHSHLSFVEVTNFADIGDIPPEEHAFIAMHNARKVLAAGFTSCLSAGAAKPRLDVALRNEIAAGRIPGPRLLAASPELTTTGGLGDERRLHMYRESVAMIVDGADEVRRAVRTLCREGVDTIKLNVSGNHTLPAGKAHLTLMSEAELAAAVEAAHSFDKRVAAHCRSAASVKLALARGVEIIYHCDFADDEALDLLEDARDRVFLAPAVGMMHDTIYRSEAFGVGYERARARGLLEELESVCRVYTELRKRGLRVLVGGDYGFPWSPHGANARDLEHFVRLFGYRPDEALDAATRLGAEAMQLGEALGFVREGRLADLLLVRGRPFEDVALLQQPENLLVVMKDGVVHKAPPGAGAARLPLAA
ncbi:MAG: amidohydrolase family protein [Burkholderiales bacterium]|nr:amidohydrolase family protein [Burkholderiales bacterium]